MARERRPGWMVAIACLIAALAAAGPAGAATITEFPVEAGAAAGVHKPFWITPAPNGTLWFSDAGTAGGVRQVSLQGEPLEAIPSVNPVDLAFDSSGTLGWVETSPGSFARRQPSGSVLRVGVDEINYAVGLAGDGTFRWTAAPTNASSAKWEICKLYNGINSCAISANAPAGRLTDLTKGSDGRLWAAAPELNRLYRLDAAGDFIDLTVTLPAGTTPTRIALAPDGNLRVAGYGNDRIYTITPAGAATPVQLPGRHGPNDIAVGPDGAEWFTEYESNSIGRLTAANEYTSYPVPTPGSRPYALTFGADGALWFTENESGKIGRLVPGDDGTGTPPAVLEPGAGSPPPIPGTGPSAPGATAFGPRTKVTLALAAARIKGAGPITVRVRNTNSFQVRGQLGARTTTAIAASRNRVITLRPKRFTVAASAKKTVKLKLSATLKRALKRSRKLKLKLSASVSDPAGHKRSVTRRVTVKLSSSRTTARGAGGS